MAWVEDLFQFICDTSSVPALMVVLNSRRCNFNGPFSILYIIGNSLNFENLYIKVSLIFFFSYVLRNETCTEVL